MGEDSRIFRVPLDWTFPDLGARVVPVGGRVEVSSGAEARTYYDTADGDLAGSGAVLSRAAGAAEPWWFVLDGAPTSVAATGRGVPAQLRDLLLGVRAGAALRVVRRVETDRTRHVVLDADGAELGEIADVREHVATTGAAASVAERRHVEIAGWDGPYLAAAAKCLRKSGAIPVDAEPVAAEPTTVGAALQDYVGNRRRDILRGDLALRRGEAPVHATRVAIRRLRSALRVVDVTEDEPRAALGVELSWFAGLLGEVRDREVLRGHLAASSDDDDVALAPARARVDTVLDAEERAAREALATAMSGRRYLAMLRVLRDWSIEPPLTADAAKPVTRLAKYAERAVGRMDKRLAAAGSCDVGNADLHRARKAAKRARYVSTMAEPVAGKPVRKAAKRAKRIQQQLGDHQDAVVAAAFLQRVAATADGAVAFGCGVLWSREAARVEKLRRRRRSSS